MDFDLYTVCITAALGWFALLLVGLAICYSAELYRLCEPWLDLVLDAGPVITIVALAGIAVYRCDRGVCQLGWYVNGVKPSGDYECRPALGDPDRDLEDALERRNIRDERSIRSAVYCTGGMHPVVVSSSVVGCQR